MLRTDWGAVWIRDLVTLATGPDGRDLLRGVMVDITEHREAEDALKRHLATLESEVAALMHTPPSNGASETPIPRSAQPPATGGDAIEWRATRRLSIPVRRLPPFALRGPPSFLAPAPRGQGAVSLPAKRCCARSKVVVRNAG